MDKTLTIILGAVFALAMFIAVTEMAQAAQPVPQYTCPIDGMLFFTYEELYNHFIAEHPTTPIEIIWE